LRIGGAIPETGDGLIEGVVRRMDTGGPLAEARVNVTGLRDGTGALSIREVLTDAGGRFAIRNLPASTYTVRVSLENYFPPSIGPISPREATASVNTNDQKTSNLTFELIPGGTISGSVRDDDGRPLPSVSVAALRIVYTSGRKNLQPAKTIPSDDRGEFRLSSIPPGEYYVRANVTYFPGVAEAELATQIAVRGGEEVSASLRIAPSKTFRISGTVVNVIPELASEPAYFVLARRGAKIDDLSAPRIFPNLGRGRGQGYFEITGARPGLYDLMPVASAQGTSTDNLLAAITQGRIRAYTGRVAVEVRDRDVEGVSVAVTRGSDLNVFVNAAGAPSLALQTTVGLGLRPAEVIPATPSDLSVRPVSADGRIQFLALPEGTYALAPVLPAGIYIADIRQAARSVYDQGVITVGRDSAEPVEVVLAAGGGGIEGRVERLQGVSGNIRVNLVPEGSRRENPLLYRNAALTEGRFVLSNIPPGNYKLYASEDWPVGADQNAEFMAPYETRGRAVTVRAGAVISGVVLPIVRR
jgi:hypothetical protein